MDERWYEQERELNDALAKAQASFPTIGKDRTVEVETKTGGRYSYSYATLSGILASVRTPLSENGLSVVQLLDHDDESGRPTLRTELRHAGGGKAVGVFPLPSVPDDPQRLGSLLTYLRRYALTAALGIAADEDDDGADAKPKGGKAKGGKAKEPKPLPDPDEPSAGGTTAGAQVQRLFAQLRAKETEQGFPNRDWTGWVRGRLGLKVGEIATAEHWERAVPILQDELAKLEEGAGASAANTGPTDRD